MNCREVEELIPAYLLGALDEKERALLHEALERSWKIAAAGNTRPAQAILDELRAKACTTASLPLMPV